MPLLKKIIKENERIGIILGCAITGSFIARAKHGWLGNTMIWGLYTIFEAINAEKWLWPIFGCKVGQSVQIGMKLQLDVWHHLLDLYTKFQIDNSIHVEKKARKSSKNPKRTKIIAKIPKIWFFQKNGT